MGLPMAKNLLRAGYPVFVHSRSQGSVEQMIGLGAHSVTSPSEATSLSSIVFTCLPDEEATQMVYLGDQGLLANSRRGQIFVETGTIGPQLARRIGMVAETSGSIFFDAPVSGGVEGAEAGTLTIMVGGSTQTFPEIGELLNTIGTNVHHVGAIGAGCLAKLTNQYLVGIHNLAAVQSLGFAERAGLRPSQISLMINSAWGYSRMFERVSEVFPGRISDSRAPIRLLVKDLGLVEEAFMDLDLDLELVSVVANTYRQAVAAGHGNLDIAGLAMALDPGQWT